MSLASEAVCRRPPRPPDGDQVVWSIDVGHAVKLLAENAEMNSGVGNILSTKTELQAGVSIEIFQASGTAAAARLFPM